MAMTDEEFERANQRALDKKRRSQQLCRCVTIGASPELSSNLEITFSPKLVEGLENAHPADFANIEISPSGLGLRFPALDVDLYLPALLDGFLGSKR